MPSRIILLCLVGVPTFVPGCAPKPAPAVTVAPGAQCRRTPEGRYVFSGSVINKSDLPFQRVSVTYATPGGEQILTVENLGPHQTKPFRDTTDWTYGQAPAWVRVERIVSLNVKEAGAVAYTTDYVKGAGASVYTTNY